MIFSEARCGLTDYLVGIHWQQHQSGILRASTDSNISLVSCGRPLTATSVWYLAGIHWQQHQSDHFLAYFDKWHESATWWRPNVCSDDKYPFIQYVRHVTCHSSTVCWNQSHSRMRWDNYSFGGDLGDNDCLQTPAVWGRTCRTGSTSADLGWQRTCTFWLISNDCCLATNQQTSIDCRRTLFGDDFAGFLANNEAI